MHDDVATPHWDRESCHVVGAHDGTSPERRLEHKPRLFVVVMWGNNRFHMAGIVPENWLVSKIRVFRDVIEPIKAGSEPDSWLPPSCRNLSPRIHTDTRHTQMTHTSTDNHSTETNRIIHTMVTHTPHNRTNL